MSGHKNMPIIIDTREQLPFLIDKPGDPGFPNMTVKYGTLRTGDYSIDGCHSPDCCYSVVIERKSISDLFGSAGRGRARLEREFQRMAEFDYAAFVIEADYRTIFHNPPEISCMKPAAVFATIMAFCQRYGVQPWACPTREFAEKCTYLLLRRFWDDRQPGGCKFK